jgi:SAM-dependent methyltransferase
MPAARARQADGGPSGRRFFDTVWSASSLVPPQRFNTWPLLSDLASVADARLEVGPGLHPRLPLAGTWFVDTSAPAVTRLAARGARTVRADLTALPFPGRSFDLVCAFDVVEHLADDGPVFRELARVARDGASVAFSVPLHPERWTAFDDLVGHCRRYDPDDLLVALDAHDLVVEQSAGFGMAPRNRWMLAFATYHLKRRPDVAMRWYENIFRPIGLWLQRPLAWAPGLLDVTRADDILLLCRRRPRTGAAALRPLRPSTARATSAASGARSTQPAPRRAGE